MTRFKSLPLWAKIALPVAVALILCVCGLVTLDLVLPEPATKATTIVEISPEPTDTLPPPTDTLPPPTDTLPPPTDTPTRTPRPTRTPLPPTETNTAGPSPTRYPTMTEPPTKTPRPTRTPLPSTSTNTPAPTPTPPPTKEPRPIVVIDYVYNDSYDEHVNIKNEGDAPADLSGWTVSGSKGDETYRFPDSYTLPAGETMRLYSGENGIDNPPSAIYWTTKTVWNNSGETVFLRDAAGNLIDQYSW